MDMNEGTPEILAAATPSPRSWHDRTAAMSKEFARALLAEERLLDLDIDAFGAIVKIHAHHRSDRPVPADVKLASRRLDIQPKRLARILEELRAANLIVEAEGYFLCPTLAIGVRPRSDLMSRVAKTRWASHRGVVGVAVPGFAHDVPDRQMPVAQEVVSAHRVTLPAAVTITVVEPSSPPITAGNAVADPLLSTFMAQGQKVESVTNEVAPSAPQAKSRKGAKRKAATPGETTPVEAMQGDLLAGLDSPPHAENVESSVSERASICPYEKLREMFNATCVSLSKVQSSTNWTPARKDVIRNRWREHPTLEYWADVFDRVQKSDFLSGRAKDSRWTASFDWIMKPANLTKIVEGNYDNRASVKRSLWHQGGKQEEGSHGDSEIDEGAAFLQAAARRRAEGGQA